MTPGTIATYMRPLSEASPLATLADVEPVLRHGSPAFFREGDAWRGVMAEMVAGLPRSRRLIDLPSAEVQAADPDLDATELLRRGNTEFVFTPVVRDQVLLGVVDRRHLAISLDDEGFRDALQAVAGNRITALGLLHDMANLVTVLQSEALEPQLECSIEHLAVLVHRLRALQLGYDMETTETDLNHIVQRSRPMLELQAGPNIDLVLHRFEATVVVSCVPGLVSRCVSNLVMNARDALNGPGRIELRCGVCPDSDQGFVEVEDNGPGIAPELQSAVFDRGFSTKSKGHWGLGLFALRRAARRDGGDLRLRSGEPGRCCFRLELPRVREAQSTAESDSGAGGV